MYSAKRNASSFMMARTASKICFGFGRDFYQIPRIKKPGRGFFSMHRRQRGAPRAGDLRSFALHTVL